MLEIKLGLGRQEIIDIYNEALRSFTEEGQNEARARAARGELGEAVPYFDKGVPTDMAVLVQFVANAIRLNNQRIEEQLKAAGFKM